jgi:hypothetical protein
MLVRARQLCNRNLPCCRQLGGLLACLLLCVANVHSEETSELARTLRTLDSRVVVLGTVRQPPLATMLAADADARLRAANRADRQAWDKVQSRADWEQFRSERLERLRASLGSFPPAPVDLKIQITRSTNGDGFTIDNLIYEGRPGLPITANLYRPTKPAASMPAIILCLSHQSLKNTSWRQDMAMTWARAGCVVLIPDHLGHGERRQHPFGDEPPHDYHFRFDLGIQLHLVGESLIGWMAWDLMRGVDLLLTRPEVDSKRLLMISEPAGGGDVAAVTAALDPRISCAMIQNFGGPEPETPYPLPRDADDSFAYAGSGSWESTRNLRLSARDGFLPWTIVASIAPRRLIYFHEFYWDEKHDPVWKRLQRVYGYYDSPQALAGLAGRGFVVGSVARKFALAASQPRTALSHFGALVGNSQPWAGIFAANAGGTIALPDPRCQASTKTAAVAFSTTATYERKIERRATKPQATYAG